MPFKAVVFAAGVGSRLKPFTDSHPKALVPVAGVPLLERVLRRIVDAGADAVVVNVHHFADQIMDFIASRLWGVPVTVSDESALLLDTAGGLAKIVREQPVIADMAPTDYVLVHNADIYTDLDLAKLMDTARLSDADALLLVDPARTSSRRLMWNADGRLEGWINTATGQRRPQDLAAHGLLPAAFGGIHAVSRRLLADIDSQIPVSPVPLSITDFYIDNCRRRDIRAYIPAEPYVWHDVGTPQKLADAERHALS